MDSQCIINYSTHSLVPQDLWDMLTFTKVGQPYPILRLRQSNKALLASAKETACAYGDDFSPADQAKAVALYSES